MTKTRTSTSSRPWTLDVFWVLVGAAGVLGASACSANKSDSSEFRGEGQGGSSSGTGGTGAGGTLGLGGGGNQTSQAGFGGECFGTTQEASNAVVPADVIWTIDTSCSMVEETAAVKANMNAFSQQIVDAGVDIRIVLISQSFPAPCQPTPFGCIAVPATGICIDPPLGSGNCPADSNLPLFAHIHQEIGSTDSLQMILQTYPTWKNQLRPNSIKIFTVVTDDNSAITAADFTTQVENLDPGVIKPGKWKAYGIYSFTNCPAAATPGDVYRDLVTQTGGVAGDLCQQQFQPVFDQLAAGIVGATQLDCSWNIPDPPDGELFSSNLVNVEFTDNTGTPVVLGKVGSFADCDSQGGWYYDDEQSPTLVEACPSTCQEIQAADAGKIDIKFGCRTIVVPK